MSIFLPTTPNPTSGFLVLVPEEDMVYLDIKPEEAIRLIMSGGFLQQDAMEQATNGDL